MSSSPFSKYPRDLAGYGRNPPDPRWPGGARVAVQFVVNFEEGAENSILHGDQASESFLTEVIGTTPWPGQRHMNVESMYEYGSRAGFWRLWRIFTARKLAVTVFGVANALARNPLAVAGMREAGWDIASHGLKWIDYKDFSYADEAAQGLVMKAAWLYDKGRSCGAEANAARALYALLCERYPVAPKKSSAPRPQRIRAGRRSNLQ